MTSPPESRRPVPLRKLSTKRFKTLAARNNDNARRRVNYAVKRQADRAWSIRPEVVAQARDAGMTWTQLDDVLATRQQLARDYMAGVNIGDQGNDLWASRLPFGPDVPDELFYYHGVFG